MSDPDPENFLHGVGRRIRETRHECGITQGDLARLSGISGPALSLIENGQRDIRLTTLRTIATALKVEIHTLLEDAPAVQDEPSPDEGYDLGGYR